MNKITITNDSNSGFNAIAVVLGLYTLHQANDFQNSNYHAFFERFSELHPQFKIRTWVNFFSWIQEYGESKRDLELLIAPVLRYWYILSANTKNKSFTERKIFAAISKLQSDWHEPQDPMNPFIPICWITEQLGINFYFNDTLYINGTATEGLSSEAVKPSFDIRVVYSAQDPQQFELIIPDSITKKLPRDFNHKASVILSTCHEKDLANVITFRKNPLAQPGNNSRPGSLEQLSRHASMNETTPLASNTHTPIRETRIKHSLLPYNPFIYINQQKSIGAKLLAIGLGYLFMGIPLLLESMIRKGIHQFNPNRYKKSYVANHFKALGMGVGYVLGSLLGMLIGCSAFVADFAASFITLALRYSSKLIFQIHTRMITIISCIMFPLGGNLSQNDDPFYEGFSNQVLLSDIQDELEFLDDLKQFSFKSKKEFRQSCETLYNEMWIHMVLPGFIVAMTVGLICAFGGAMIDLCRWNKTSPFKYTQLAWHESTDKTIGALTIIASPVMIMLGLISLAVRTGVNGYLGPENQQEIVREKSLKAHAQNGVAKLYIALGIDVGNKHFGQLNDGIQSRDLSYRVQTQLRGKQGCDQSALLGDSADAQGHHSFAKLFCPVPSQAIASFPTKENLLPFVKQHIKAA